MTPLTLAAIEQSLLPYRIGRRIVSKMVLEYIASSKELMNPFSLLSRLFIRLKSADSILEKIHRKGLAVNTVSDIGRVMVDLLGFRIITDSLEEIRIFDQFLSANFEVISRVDTITSGDRFGYRAIEYELVYGGGSNGEIPFEVQLRTLLQHYWASKSFTLFHKAPPTKALEYIEILTALSNVLAEAECLASRLSNKDKGKSIETQIPPNLQGLPIYSQVNLIVVEPTERFVQHTVIPLSGDDLRDHQTIVERKMALYAEFPDAAIIECSCMNFATFALNEPQVEIPPEKMDCIVW